MRRSAGLATWVALVCMAAARIAAGQTSKVPEQGLEAITAGRLLSYASFLASERMRGRDTPSPELDSCAAFLATRLRAAGWQVQMQPFTLMRTRLGEPNHFILRRDGKNVVYRLRHDFSPAHMSGSGEVEAEVAFVGYGITAPEYGYDDYATIDVRGKVVLLFTQEPQEDDSTSVFAGAQETVHSSLLEKVGKAQAHGAVGVLVVTDPRNHRFVRPPYEWRDETKSGQLVLKERAQTPLVVMRLGKKLAEDVIAPSGYSLSQLQARIDSTLAPQSFLVPGVEVRMVATITHRRFSAQNVIGVWEGSDPVLKSEVVVVGAHYDHLGVRGDTLIFSGADNNASGTAGLLGVAEALAAVGKRPRRTVVCIAFAGEEKGLFGSRYYVANPLFPLATTVAMLNMDMIGRNDSGAVEVSCGAHARTLQALVERANAALGFHLGFAHGRAAAGSDATPFHWRGVPALAFSTGLHADYHQPTDTVEKLAGEHLARVVRLAFATTWLLANEELVPAAASTRNLPGGADRATATQGL